MCALLDDKEAELAEVKSEAEDAHYRLADQQRQLHTMQLESELEKLRELETLRKEFDQERMQLRKDRECDIFQFREWKREMTTERDGLSERVKALTLQLKGAHGVSVDMDDCTTSGRLVTGTSEDQDSRGTVDEAVPDKEESVHGASGAVRDPTGDASSSRGEVDHDPTGDASSSGGEADHHSTGETPMTVPGTEALAHPTKVQPAAGRGVPGDQDRAAGQVSADSLGGPSSTIAGRDEHNTAAREQGGPKRQVHFSTEVGAQSGDTSATASAKSTRGRPATRAGSPNAGSTGVSARVGAEQAHSSGENDVSGGTREEVTEPSSQSVPDESTEANVMQSVTRLLEAQRLMMAAQVQAMAVQSVPPLRKFSGDDIDSDEGSIDRWIEQFEERAKVMGWNNEQKLFQLKAHLEKTAEHAVRMLSEVEKTKYESVVTALRNRFRSLDIEELRGLEFHQLMQDQQSVEELGVQLQRLGRKAFVKSGPKEFDRMLKGRFYQALLPKWQRKLGAPKTTESFDELYARARTLERHDQQFSVGRNDSKQQRGRSKVPGKTDLVKNPEESPRRDLPHRNVSRFTGNKGCFNCGHLGHIQRNCPDLRADSTGRFQKPNLTTRFQKPDSTARSGKVSTLSAAATCESAEELSVQQLEQLLAKKRLGIERTQLGKGTSKIDTVVSDSTDAVGPVVYLELAIEGYPVKAMVDSGAQSTILSRGLLHQVARHMQSQGRAVPSLVQPSARLYGRSGNDCSELIITAQTNLELALDGRTVIAPVFVQPGSDIECLLGTNVLPYLGVKFLRENGEPLLMDPPPPARPPGETDRGPSAQQQDEQLTQECKKPLATSDDMTQIQPDESGGCNVSCHRELPVPVKGSQTESKVCIVRSTYLPNRHTTVVEAKLQAPFEPGEILLFEPNQKMIGLEMPEALLTQQPNGCILIPAENHGSLSTRLEPGDCVGTVAPIDSALLCESDTPQELTRAARDSASSHPVSDLECAQENDAEERKAHCAQVCEESSPLTGRVQELFRVLSLEQGTLTDSQFSSLKELIADHADVFALDNSELGHTDLVQHHVDTGTSPPVRQPARRVPFVHREKISAMVEEMEHLGVVKPSGSSWASPVVLVPKKDGTDRFCVDYRKLNGVTRKDVYPLPRIDDILDTLGGKKFFSTLDLAAGYWQIGLDAESTAKSAFATHRGLHEFTRMPFGMCNAPATFQRLMEVVLAGLIWDSCFAYIDDVLVCSHTFEDHLEHLRQVFSRLRQAGLRLKARKCLFLREEVPYLGHVVTRSGIKPDPSKTEKMRNYPPPTDVSEVRQFLGLASYYRRFVPQFASIASPLHSLLKKDAVFSWTSECQKAFDRLKNLLVSAPVLAYPQFQSKYPFILETDASKKGLGAVLAQQQEDGRVHPVAFASRSLSPNERNYAITELETLGLVWAAKLFRPYILGHRCVVFTDHAACTSLLNSKNPSSKLVRWAMVIQELNLDIRHRSGKSNYVADALSRNPVNVANVLAFQSVESPLSTLTPDSDIGKLQRSDKEFQPIFRYLEDDVLPTDERQARKLVLEKPNFEILDGVLCYRNPAIPDGWRIAVPQDLRSILMKENHEGRFAGHFAERKLYCTLRARYWWQGMRADVRRFCRSCLVCVSRKGPGRAKHPKLQPIPVGGPFHMVGVDVLQLPLSHNGHQYAIVFMDYLTKWPEVFAAEDQTAETIARLLVEHVISRHGVPEYLLSDRGPNFLSNLVQQVCKLVGTSKINTSGYHPQCDGLVEKFNSTLINMLSKSVGKYGRDWDCHLPYLLFAYRVAIQDSTQASPFYLLYGREPRVPTETALSQPRTPYQVEFSDYCAELVANLSDAWALAHENIAKAQNKQKRQYDKRSLGHQLKVGDRVMVYFPGQVKGKAWKFARPHCGPYKVLSLTPTNAEVQLLDCPGDMSIFVALDRVRRCYDEMTDEVWLGHGVRRKKKKQAVKHSGSPTPEPAEYTGPVTRARARKS